MRVACQSSWGRDRLFQETLVLEVMAPWPVTIAREAVRAWVGRDAACVPARARVHRRRVGADGTSCT